MELLKTFKIWLLSLTSLFISVYSTSPNFLELCAFRRVCKGQFGNRPSDLSTIEFGNSPCFCDEDCIVYGDCCYDAAVQTFGQSNPTSYICAPIPGMDYSIYIKKECNIGWKGDNIRNLCEHPIIEETLSNIYVTSLRHGTTYGNIFCAVCNGEKFNLSMNVDLKFWETQLTNPIALGTKFISSTLDLFDFIFQRASEGWIPDDVNRTVISKDVVIINNIPPDVDKYRNLRRCKMIIDNCAGAWFNPPIEQRCKTFTHYVYDMATFQLYKNIYCAVCNFVTYENLRCLKSDILGINDEQATKCPQYQYFNTDKNMCLPYPFLLGNNGGVNPPGFDPSNFPITTSVIHNCPIGHSLYGLHCLPDVSLM